MLPIRQYLWAIVAIATAIILAYILLSITHEGAQGESSGPSISKWDTRIVALEKEAMEEAFKRYMIQLYNIWVTDNYQSATSPRALASARSAREAFIKTMDAIEKREQQIKQRQ
jgi:hypothetical protein